MIKIEDLKEGVVLNNTLNNTTDTLEINAVRNKVIEAIDQNNDVVLITIRVINDFGYTIQQPTQYYKGFKIGKLDKPVIMYVMDAWDAWDAFGDAKSIRVIIEIKADGFIDSFEVPWKYAEEVPPHQIDYSQIKENYISFSKI